MTKYEELCDLYAKSEKHFLKDFEACLAMSGIILKGLTQHLNCPSDLIEIIPIDREPKPGEAYGPAGALQLGEDSFYHFGISVNLSGKSVRLRISLKKVEEGFSLKFGDHPEVFIISHEGGELTPFLEFVFKKIKEYFKNIYSSFMQKGEGPHKLGFI
jgi:hypothetical protein